jgi:hypothetical protein
MIVLVAGCLSDPAAELPTSFLTEFRNRGQTFTAAPASLADESPDAMVRYIRQNGHIASLGRAVPVFGVLTCVGGHPGCLRQERQVWLVIFPDATSPNGDVAWALLGDDDDFKTLHDPSE